MLRGNMYTNQKNTIQMHIHVVHAHRDSSKTLYSKQAYSPYLSLYPLTDARISTVIIMLSITGVHN